MKDFQDRVAVVTGAAGGIGRATAIELARQGCHLAISDINGEGLQETAGEIEALGRKVSTHVMDVADKAAMEAFPQAVLDAHGRVDIVVNNAGVAVSDYVESISLEDFEWIVGINFWGVVYGTRFFLPHMIKAGEGHIVNISSLFGIIGVPSQAAYCATKFAVRGFTESLRIEMMGTGIGVTAVHPGGVRTNIARSARYHHGPAGETDQKVAAADFDRIARTTPESAGRQIAKAIRRNQGKLRIGADARLLDRIARLMPVGYQRLVHKAMVARGKTVTKQPG